MPFGLWKSKWQLLREDTLRRDDEWEAYTERRDAECHVRDKERRVYSERREAEWREYNDRRDAEWREWREEWTASEARAEARHQELMSKLDENNRGVETALAILTQEVVGMRTEVHGSTDSVKSQTQAIFRLVDRFDEFERRRPPGSPPLLRPV
jgi:hypothetical protein